MAKPPQHLAVLASKGGDHYDSDENKAKTLNAPMLFRMINLHIHKTEAELKEFLANPDNYVIEKIVCRALLDAAKNGTINTFDYFVSRLIGKTPEHIILTENNPYKDLPLEEVIRLRNARLEANRERFNHIMNGNDRMKALEAKFKKLEPDKADDSDAGF